MPAPEKFYGLVAVPDDPLREAFVVSQYTTLAELRDCELRRSHFASCPDSAAWRKKQTAAKA